MQKENLRQSNRSYLYKQNIWKGGRLIDYLFDKNEIINTKNK